LEWLGLILPNLISPNPNPYPNPNPDCHVCNEVRLGEMRRHPWNTGYFTYCSSMGLLSIYVQSGQGSYLALSSCRIKRFCR